MPGHPTSNAAPPGFLSRWEIETRSLLSWLIDTDWPVLAVIFIIYSQFPDRLRIFNADLLLGMVVATLLLRAMAQPHRFGDMRAAVALVVLYGLVAAASLSWAADEVRARLALERLAKDLLLFLIVTAALVDGRSVRRAAWTIVAAGILMTAAPIYQWFTGNYGNDLWGFGGTEIAHLWGSIDGYRVTGTVSDPNYFAQSLLPVIALGFGLLWTARRAVLVACTSWSIVAALGCIILTYSRGAVVALAVVIPLLVLAYTPRRRSATIVAVLVLAAIPFVDGIYVRRLMTFGQFTPARRAEIVREPGFKGRMSEMLAGVQMFRDHPIGGVGLGNYESNYRRYAKEIGIDLREEDRQAHSLPIEIAAETGLVGLAAWGALLLAVTRRIYVARDRARMDFETLALVTAIGVGMSGYLTTSLFLHDAYQRQLWIIAALGYACASISPRGELNG
jgi:O-antigen ligase